jgi:uncharacterized protein
LACARDGQPYITLMYFSYDEDYLYSFSTLGQKIAWVRANPLVCVEVEELASPRDWATVIVLGKYQELPDTPQYKMYRKRAYDLLRMRPMWWEPGYVKTVLNEKTRPMESMYFRIHIDHISGHRGIPDTVSHRELSATHVDHAGWLRKILRCPEHQKGDH